MRAATTAVATAPPTGSRWARPAVAGAWTGTAAAPVRRPRRFSFILWSGMRSGGYGSVEPCKLFTAAPLHPPRRPMRRRRLLSRRPKPTLSSREALQMSESDLERELNRRGQELMRKLLQGHLDQRSPGRGGRAGRGGRRCRAFGAGNGNQKRTPHHFASSTFVFSSFRYRHVSIRRFGHVTCASQLLGLVSGLTALRGATGCYQRPSLRSDRVHHARSATAVNPLRGSSAALRSFG